MPIPESVARQELEVHPEIIGFVTTTYYKNWFKGKFSGTEEDKIRGDLALQTVRRIIADRHQLVVVDGGSSKEFLAELKSSGAEIHTQVEKTMSGSRRQALSEVKRLSGIRAGVWCEPEKVDFAGEHCLVPAVLPVLQGTKDILIPQRSIEAFASIPKDQAEIEQELNYEYTEVLRRYGLWSGDDLDVSFGPRVIINRPEVTALFQRIYRFKEGTPDKIKEGVNLERYPNSNFFPIIAGLKMGLRIGKLTLEYRHPDSQTALEQGDEKYILKRESQKYEIVNAAKYFIQYLFDMDNSLIEEVKV